MPMGKEILTANKFIDVDIQEKPLCFHRAVFARSALLQHVLEEALEDRGDLRAGGVGDR